MKILVIGCGLQGFEIARDLRKDKNIQLGVADIDTKRLQRCRQIGVSSIHRLDITNRTRLCELVKRYDVIIGAVPGRFGFNLVKNVIESGRDMVDISFMPENILKLDRLAKKHRVRIIPDCGLAPGLSNILVGHALSALNKVKEISIAVGGLPQIPRPPLNYRTVFSLEDVLEVYTRKVKIIKDGHIKEIAPLSGLEKIEFADAGTFPAKAAVPAGRQGWESERHSPVGRRQKDIVLPLECFYTDGLRTLLHTARDVPNMAEKTIRYQGHSEKIRTLIECGFLDASPVEFTGKKIIPRDFSLSLLGPKLSLGKEKDFIVMRVVVRGEKTLKYEMVDYYRDGATAMARTTGYPCAVVARLIKRINKVGIIPPEELGKDETLFPEILRQLERRNIRIKRL